MIFTLYKADITFLCSNNCQTPGLYLNRARFALNLQSFHNISEIFSYLLSHAAKQAGMKVVAFCLLLNLPSLILQLFTASSDFCQAAVRMFS